MRSMAPGRPAALDALNRDICIWPLDIHTRHGIIQSLWKRKVDSEYKPQDIAAYDSYLGYYSEQCRLALHDRGKHVSVRTHQDIIAIANLLEDSHTRELVNGKIPSPSPEQNSTDGSYMLDGSINLVARLLVMIEIGSLQYGISCQRSPVWEHGSLQHFIAEQFEPSKLLGKETVKLERIFNARNLERISGIQIVWTSNLVDHLRIIDDDKRVAIFHHASFLKCQQDSKNFPPGLIDETLRTLELLLPQWDKETKKWFRKLQSLELDLEAIKCGQLRAEERRIENFSFWHDRLVILKQVFDEATPYNLSQWWYDRRNPVQYYTFWVAIFVLFLTAFFGMIQSIEGALQVYKTFYPS